VEYIDFFDNDNTCIKDFRTEDEDGFLCVRIKSDMIWNYHMQTVLTGKCSAVLPMRCIKNAEETEVLYCIDGLKRVDRYISDNMCSLTDILSLVLSLISCIRSAEKYLISENELIISAETLYIDTVSGSMKIVYDPSSVQKRSFFYMIIDMLKELSVEEYVDMETRTGLANFCALAVSGCRGLEDLEKLTNQYICAMAGKKGALKSNQKELSGSNPKGARQIVKEALIKLIT